MENDNWFIIVLFATFVGVEIRLGNEDEEHKI